MPIGVLALAGLASVALGGAEPLPDSGWQSRPIPIKALEGAHHAAVGHPPKEAAAAVYRTPNALAPGLYRLTATIRPTHVTGPVAWTTRLKATAERAEVIGRSSWRGISFARLHEPETRVLTLLVPRRSRVTLRFAVEADPKAFEKLDRERKKKAGGLDEPSMSMDGGGGAMGMSLELSAKSASYYVIDGLALERVADRARVARVEPGKVRYEPGATLEGSVTLARIADEPVRGRLELWLEHGVATRERKKTRSLTLDSAEKKVRVELALPERELGHALVARFVPEDGAAHERSTPFSIADNPYRTAIYFGGPVHNKTFSPAEHFDRRMRRVKDTFANFREIFFWAPEDMIEMSPERPYWFSGQTTYHMSKRGLKAMIRVGHKHGHAFATYGKFIMSGYLGWRRAYRYPFAHKRQYAFDVGMWNKANVAVLDRFRNEAFVGRLPIKEDPLWGKGFGLPFLPINPDPVPRNVRRAAAEVKRSIAMFGWDAIRWDGHPRVGGHGETSPLEKRKTQTLVRYFKDLVEKKYPDFEHGYNALPAPKTPSHEWFRGNYEMNELARDGGLVMNEAIGNQGAGRSYRATAEILQVQGDAIRERGGCYLAIPTGDDGNEPARDRVAQAILWYAAGARPYMGSVSAYPRLNRYATRYSKYVLDQRLRRLTQPAKVIEPKTETRLWWDPFVYQTPVKDGRAQLVVNLINLPPETKLLAEEPKHRLEPGSDPVPFAVKPPKGCSVERVRRIDPWTLEVKTLDHAGGTVPVGPVNLWSVLVVDLAVDAGAATPAQRWGPPKTTGAPVPEDAADGVPKEPVVLDANAPLEKAQAQYRDAFPRKKDPWWREDPALASMSFEKRNATLRNRRTPLERYLEHYPYGLTIPADRKRRKDPPDFGGLAPRRDGMADVFLAKGPMAHRFRFYEAFAAFERVRVREARYVGSRGKRHRLRGNITPKDLAGLDVCVYAGVPHPAIGVKQAYALRAWVKAGGGLLMTGGEYAFGKGRYAYTVLDRALLPVTCIEPRDTRYVEEPIAVEAGPALDALGVEASFEPGPAIWHWNEVALKPDGDVKVFLEAGNRPVLVGWKRGKGRVACLLTSPRGRDLEGRPVLFQWRGWPKVMAALMRWLAPDATATNEGERAAPERVAAVRKRLAGDAMKRMLGGVGEDGGGSGPARELEESALAKRREAIELLIAHGGSEAAEPLAAQLAAVRNLPLALRYRVLDFVAAHPFDGVAGVAERCLKSADPHVRGSGHVLLAIAGDRRLAQIVRAEPNETVVSREQRRQYLALAVALYEKPLLREAGRRRIEKWNQRAAEVKREYTGGEGFSLRHPRAPCLSSRKLFRRAAWLAYMSRWAPERYAPAFVREWARLEAYDDLSARARAGFRRSASKSSGTAEAQAKRSLEALDRFRKQLAALETLTRPRAVKATRDRPAAAGRGLTRLHFLEGVKSGIDLLGAHPADAVRPALERAKREGHELLAAFARGRLEADR